MRRLLDTLYTACGIAAARFLVAIGVLVLTSIITRLLGLSVPGLTNYAGYCMAASSFLALAYTLRKGGHIRVSILLQHLHGWRRRLAELWCLGVGFLLAAWFAWYSVKMVRVSLQISDISPGPDATPLWIPQIAMAAGTTVLAIALLDRLIDVARGGEVEEEQQQID
ncbi:MAG: TRAP transporter small permease [Geminicoccaceae bacterium]|nr:TRAP transporter small permease [Geminicoccaceae bacterium]